MREGRRQRGSGVHVPRLSVFALLLAALLVGTLSLPAEAAPWWWAQFSPGRQTVGGNSDGIQDLQGRFVSSAGNADTVIMTSYTWYSTLGSSHMVNGSDEDTIPPPVHDFGLVAEANAAGRTAPVRVVHDSEGSGVANMLRDINGHPIVARGYDDTRFSEVHNKLIYVANRGVMTGSGNFSGAQTHNFGSQPNNYVWLHYGQVPSAVNAFGTYLESLSSGVAMRPSRGSFLYNPTGKVGTDTVEVYFSNDDNDSITTHAHFNPSWGPAFSANGGYDIEDVLIHRSERAVESILYAINRYALTNNNGNNASSSIKQAVVANTTAFKAGIVQSSNDFNAPLCYGVFSADHTSRDGSNWPNGTGGASNQMHHKFMVFDLEIVATGSANHTGAAMRDDGTWTGANVENEILIHDFRAARRFVQQWHYLMDNCPTNAGAGGDAYGGFKNNRPGAPTNLAVTPTATNFQLTWTAPATNMDSFSRYFVFISPNPIRVQRDIGDARDDDGDSLIDEDPVGDVDGFSTGSANDDDADGVDDDDPWLYPEAQVKGGGTSVTLSSVNCGDALAGATNYWFAVVAVDTLGFESILDTAGPYQLGAAETKLVVRLNSEIADTNAARGETNVVVSRLFIRGDTGAADTLSIIAVKNVGTADSADVTVKLWRDENADSAITAVDSLVATLAWNAAFGSWRAVLANDSRAALGTTGRNFLVTLDVSGSATIGDTFQLRIDALTCSSPRRDSGPSAAITNAGKVTIVSANQVTVVKRGDTPSATVAKGETFVAMTLRIGVTTANDTLTGFAVTNLGTMQHADVAGILLYEDAGADSVLTGADTLIAALPNAGGATWRNSAISRPFTGTSLNVLVVVGAASGATGSRTFQGRIDALEVKMATADTGPLAAVATTAVFTVASDTSPDTAVVLNELVQSPNSQDHDNDGTPGDDADEEYVELYNNSDGSVDIGGWKISDAAIPNDLTLPAGLVLGPREFLAAYRGPDSAGNYWYRYSSNGRTIRDSGAYGAGTFPALSADTVYLFTSANVLVDSKFNEAANDKATARAIDGFNTWLASVSPTPGLNQDPTPAFNRPSPNGFFTGSVDSASPTVGSAFTLTMTVKDADGGTVAGFSGVASLSVSSGSISPTTTGTFAGGIRAESVTITGMTGVCTITVVYNTTTTGTALVTVQAAAGPPAADTRTVVALNSDNADSAVPVGSDTVVALRFRVRGDTTGSGDTLAVFTVENLGLASDLDVSLELWRDENNDSAWTAGVDTKLATLSRGGSIWSASGLSTLPGAYLGSGATAGRNFLVIANVHDTTTPGDTLQLRIPANGVRCAVYESGPTGALTTTGKFTIVSGNQVAVSKRGDTPSGSIPKGETRVVMTLTLTVGQATDTLTRFTVANTGTMVDADVAGLYLYHDGDGDSVLDGAGTDSLVGALGFVSGSTWRSAALTYTFAGTSVDLLVVLFASPTATGSRTFTGQVPASDVKTTKADTGPLAAVTTTATFTIPSDYGPDTLVVINEANVNPGSGDVDGDGDVSEQDEEYVEVYNRGTQPVDIAGWSAWTKSVASERLYVTSSESVILQPGWFGVFKTESTVEPAANKFFRIFNESGVLVDTAPYGSNEWTAAGGVFNVSNDSVVLKNATGTTVDSWSYGLSVDPDEPLYLRIDGGDSWTVGLKGLRAADNTTTSYGRPNSRFVLACTPSLVSAGDSFTLVVQALDNEGVLVTGYAGTATLSAAPRTIAPTTSGTFSGGVRAESVSIASVPATETVVIRATSGATTGTTALVVGTLATVTAVIDLEARADESGCTGMLRSGTETYISVSNASGTITFVNVKAGTYELTIRHDQHLRRIVQNLTVSGSDTTLSAVTLLAGDVNQDNRINIQDAAKVRFGMRGGTLPAADVDGSGTVTANDLGWVRRNFGQAAP